jgi:hypothetical protein
MAVERMPTGIEPAAELVGHTPHEPRIEDVFGNSGGHAGRVVSGLREYRNPVRAMKASEEFLGGVHGRLTRRPRALIGMMEAYPMPLSFADITSPPAVPSSPRRR